MREVSENLSKRKRLLKIVKQFLQGTYPRDNKWKNIITLYPINKTKHAEKLVNEKSHSKTKRALAKKKTCCPKIFVTGKKLLCFLRYYKKKI